MKKIKFEDLNKCVIIKYISNNYVIIRIKNKNYVREII